MNVEAREITNCTGCPLGQAAHVAEGGACPFSPHVYGARQVIHREGAPADAVGFVKSGAVAVVRSTPGGHEVISSVRRPGDLVGGDALVRDHYAEGARAVGSAVVCRAPRHVVDRWLGAPSPARTMLEVMVKTLADERPRGATPDGSAVRRAASWIASHERATVQTEMPRRILAELLGMTPETLSRALSALRRRGVIDVTPSEIRVRDAEALEQIAAM